MYTSFIWDLDGTLIDSYHTIVDCLWETMRENGFTLDKQEIYHYTKTNSVMGFIELYGKKYGFDWEKAKRRYSELNETVAEDVTLMDGAAETLRGLAERGARHFVFTHRGVTAVPILRRLGIEACFTEIVSVKDGWRRKPDPEGLLYLVEKYHLPPEETCYVGDRSMDIQCAKNAGIGGVLYLPSPLPGLPCGLEDRVIADLRALL